MFRLLKVLGLIVVALAPAMPVFGQANPTVIRVGAFPNAKGWGQLVMMGRDLNDMSQVLAVMILIIGLGYLVDGLVFRTVERQLQERWRLAPAS